MREPPDRTPTLAEALRLAFDNVLSDVFVAMPCKVQRYDAERQRADLIPQIRRPLRAKDGTLYTEGLPVLPAVQVLHTGGGGVFIQHELRKGDTVLAVFCDLDPGNWVASGSDEPVDDRYHAIGSAVCFPVRFQGAPAFAHLAMGHDNGRQIHVKTAEVCLGSENPADVVTLAAKMVQAFNAHTHECSAPGLASKSPTVPLTAEQIGSSVVKSD